MLETIVVLLVAWFVLSIPVGLFVGRFLTLAHEPGSAYLIEQSGPASRTALPTESRDVKITS